MLPIFRAEVDLTHSLVAMVYTEYNQSLEHRSICERNDWRSHLQPIAEQYRLGGVQPLPREMMFGAHCSVDDPVNKYSSLNVKITQRACTSGEQTIQLEVNAGGASNRYSSWC